MAADSLLLLTLENNVTRERDPLAFLAGVLARVPIVVGGQPTTVGALLSAIPSKQDGDAALTSLAALAMEANRLIYATGPDTLATSALTEFGRTLLARLDAQSARQALELGSAATRSTGDFLQIDAAQVLTAQRMAQGRTNLGIGSGDSPSFNGLTLTEELVVGQGKNASTIRMFDSDEGARFLHNNSGSIGFLASDGSWRLRVYDNGDVWTAQLGDLAAAFNRRVRFDSPQALTGTQRTQLWDNLAFNLTARTFVTAATVVDMRAAIGLEPTATPRFTGVVLGAGASFVYSDNSAGNLIFRVGNGSTKPFKYISINEDGVLNTLDITASGSRVWTEGTAAGSIAADASYAIQRFPSGEAIIKGTSVVTLDASGRAIINVGLTAAAGTWLGMAWNGDFGVSKAVAIPGLYTATGFTVEFQNAANTTVRVNWFAWGRWK